MRADHGAGIQIIALGTGDFLELERTSNSVGGVVEHQPDTAVVGVVGRVVQDHVPD